MLDIATGIGTKWVNVYSTEKGELIHELRLTSGNAAKSKAHPKKPVLFVSTDNATVEILDLSSGETVGIVAARGQASLADNIAFIRGDDVNVARDDAISPIGLAKASLSASQISKGRLKNNFLNFPSPIEKR